MSKSHCGCGKGLRTAPAVVLLFLAALFSAAAISGRARAQAADDLDRLNHEIERLYGENKTVAAVPLAERYVELARQRYGGTIPNLRRR